MTSKYYLLKITGNLTSGTIFLTSTNYRITNHRPRTKIFTIKTSYRFSFLSLSAFTKIVTSSSIGHFKVRR